MNFRTLYDHGDRAEDILLYGTLNPGPSLTQKSDAKDADINVIVRKYVKTGQLPQMTLQALTGDFTNALDFRQAQEHLKAARDAFEALPAAVRKRFGNDPAEFIDFATNEENIAELRKLGLAPEPEAPPPKPEPMEVRVINDLVPPK